MHACIPTYEFNNSEKGFQLESGGIMRRPQGRVAGRAWREERRRKGLNSISISTFFKRMKS